MNEINNRYDVYAAVAEQVRELGLVKEVSTSKPLRDQGFDSIDVVDMSLRLETQIGIENLVISNGDTPADVADNAWRMLTKTVE